MEFDLSKFEPKPVEQDEQGERKARFMQFMAELDRGDYDNVMDVIAERVQNRNAVIGMQRGAAVLGNARAGQKVKLVNVRPKAAEGLVCEISHRDGKKVYVRIPYTVSQRLRAGQVISWPVECYELVNDTD